MGKLWEKKMTIQLNPNDIEIIYNETIYKTNAKIDNIDINIIFKETICVNEKDDDIEVLEVIYLKDIPSLQDQEEHINEILKYIKKNIEQLTENI